MDGGGIAQCIHSSLHWQFANKAALFIRMPAPSLGTTANDVSQNVLGDLEGYRDVSRGTIGLSCYWGGYLLGTTANDVSQNVLGDSLVFLGLGN